MAKSDARFEYKANLGRTDHNLSQPLGFTSAAGMLLPIWFDYATPGDSYYMQHDLPLLRSIQLLAPSMVDVKVHFETFFVPMQMIYQPFENTMFSLNQYQSSFISGPDNFKNNAFPLLDFDGVINAISTTYTDHKADAYRMTDLLGLAPTNFATGLGLTDYRPNFFPYQILAYHTIFQYYYRLDDKSEFSNSLCNWDQFYGNLGNINAGYTFFDIHQRPWDFDYFMSVYRSPIVSNDNMQSILPYGFYNDLTGSAQIPVDKNGNQSFVGNDFLYSFSNDIQGTHLESNIQGGISTVAIRQMFANEKLAMITGRTRKNYDSQVLAHYGINVPHDVKHDLTMIHHDEYDLNVQEVTSLASTSDAPLGELAGKSYSAGNGKQFKFTAPCHGVMMTIFSIEPKKRYITNFDRINAITNAYDLPTPEFDRLGNVPMYRYECGYRKEIGSRQQSDIIAWKERYYQFKRKPARLTTAFINPNGANDYASYFISALPFGKSALTKSGSGTISTSCDPRPDLEDRFYIERSSTDCLCLVPFYDGWMAEEEGENWNNTPWLLYKRDPFIVNSHIKCKKVSWMSKDGEPVYNF